MLRRQHPAFSSPHPHSEEPLQRALEFRQPSSSSRDRQDLSVGLNSSLGSSLGVSLPQTLSSSLGPGLLDACVAGSQHSILYHPGIEVERKVVFYVIDNVCVMDDPDFVKKIPLEYCRATMVSCNATAEKLQAALAELCQMSDHGRDDKCSFYLVQKDERPLPLSDNKIIQHAMQDGEPSKYLIALWPRLCHTIRSSLTAKKSRGKKRSIADKLLDLHIPLELVDTITSILNDALHQEVKDMFRSRERGLEPDPQMTYLREQSRMNVLNKLKYSIESVDSDKRATCLSELKEYINKFFRNRIYRHRKPKLLHVHQDGITTAGMIDSDNEHNPWWSRKIE